MTIPISSRVLHVHPMVLHDTAPRPPAMARFALHELCVIAQVPCRVTGSWTTITLISGHKSFYRNSHRWVGIGNEWRPTRTAALRVLETLAYSFFDYGARECLGPMRHQLFCAPKRMGRPTRGARAMTARERMAAMRRRRRGIAAGRDSHGLQQAKLSAAPVPNPPPPVPTGQEKD